MIQEYEKLIDRLIKHDMFIREFFIELQKIQELEDFNINTILDAKCFGLDIKEDKNSVILQTKNRSHKEQKFCIVDIETNGCSPKDGKIIEIGAVVLQNNEVQNEFHSLVFCENLSENIVELTGITNEALKDAPSEASVLEQFRLFLGDSVFVAHNVEFDFRFLSHTYIKYGYAPLLNRKLCTISLARKMIEAPKYGLQTLREILGINEGVHHRALWDAKSAAEIFKIACQKLPCEIVTTEDLVAFAKSNYKNIKK